MSYATRIRPILRDEQHSDGLTISEISAIVKLTPATVHKALIAMPDAYIDRWSKSNTNAMPYTAVWCVVVPPENCPKPGSES